MKKSYPNERINLLTIGKLDTYPILEYIKIFDKYPHENSLNNLPVPMDLSFAKMEVNQKKENYNLLKFYEYDENNDKVLKFYDDLANNDINEYKIEYLYNIYDLYKRKVVNVAFKLAKKIKQQEFINKLDENNLK